MTESNRVEFDNVVPIADSYKPVFNTARGGKKRPKTSLFKPLASLATRGGEIQGGGIELRKE